MRTYSQFCPVARASELLAERWTPIIVRNLLLGCSTFGEIAAGAPGIPRGLLAKRLRELERADIIVIRPKPGGRGSVYELTPAGRELWSVVQAMHEWGLKWLEVAPAHASPDVVLWSWCTSYLHHHRLPDRRVVVRFDFPDQPTSRRRVWLLVERGGCEVCAKHPGFDEDLIVTVENAQAFARWHLALLEWGEALRSGDIRVDGPRPLAQALPTWNRRVGGSQLPLPAEGSPMNDKELPGSNGDRRPGRPEIPGFAGDVLTPGDDGAGDVNYDAARRVWNGAIDRRPKYIARCRDSNDVAAALHFARDRGLMVAVRGGGHGVAGLAVCDDGLVIDLSTMKGIHVDPARRRVQAAAGVVWGELDTAAQAFGLATTGGVVSHTGIAGLTLGGGIGWLMRKHGLTVDNLLAAEVVTADGDLVVASEAEHPDLFWGLRGGGGNFGVVTSFTYQLHPVGPNVLAGPVLWALEDAPDVLRSYRELVAAAPPEITTIVTLRKAPPLPVLPDELHRRPVCMISMCYAGDPANGERVLAPLRGIGRPLLDLVAVRPYTALQSMLDKVVPHGWHYYWKSASLAGLPDPVVDTMVEHAARIMSPWSYVITFQLGGAVADVAQDATAVPARDAAYIANINGVWLPGEPVAAAEVEWTREFFAALQPYETGAYVNFLDHDDGERVQSAYSGPSYRRLVALKDRYDPNNVFRLNQNVQPSRWAAG